MYSRQLKERTHRKNGKQISLPGRYNRNDHKRKSA